MTYLRSALIGLLAMCTALAGAVAVAPEAAAAPAFTPKISVYLADGVTPVGNTQLHPGDVVVVKGRGFDPNANTSGLPVPVPPGVPHGTFIAFGPFAKNWRPSQDAPEEARPTNRSNVKWAISDAALAQVPDVPFDMRRTVRGRAVTLHRNGTFTAPITLSTPEDIPADGRWGIYTYGGANAINAAQEIYVPINYSTAPGANTPKPAERNLIWKYSPDFYQTVVGTTQGAVSGKEGAGVDEKTGALSFELVSNTVKGSSGDLRYRGTVVVNTRFNLFEIALVDPVIRVRGGKAVLSMKTSTTDMNGTDVLRRVNIADLTLSRADLARLSRGEDVAGVRAAFRSGITPTSLALLSTGPASPVTLRF
ncbi:HtaA domain-containing protein [Gordonia sp. VNK21]|uniref:HtaA domain-containing protein n=1 Tax=Gordonia sp. VNK21 TaxID=3382483 RepID=UPI0038D3C632